MPYLSALQVRTAIFTAAQLSTYDEAKRWCSAALGTGPGDLATQLGASLASGLVTTTAVAPADIVKTRMFAGGGWVVLAVRRANV